MSGKVTIGVDPGAKGGIAVLETATDKSLMVLLAAPAPRDTMEIRALGEKLSLYFSEYRCRAYIEHVHAMPRQGVSSMFSFGRSVGMWEGFLGAWGIRCEYVAPQTWQKLTAPMAGLTTKDRSIRFASVAFPNTPLVPKGARKPSDGIADALCIAYYGAKAREAAEKDG